LKASSFDIVLANVCKNSLDDTIAEYCQMEANAIFHRLENNKIELLSQKILSLPDDYMGLLFLKYIFECDEAFMKSILDISDIKGNLVYIKRLLAASLDLPTDAKIDDYSIKEACAEAIDKYVEFEIDNEAIFEQPDYSPKFRKELKFIKSIQQKPNLVMVVAKRVAVVLVVATVGFAGTLTANAQLRENFFKWLVNTFPTFSEFIALPSETVSDSDYEILKQYRPTYLPDGFEEHTVFDFSPWIIREYRDIHSGQITIQGRLPDSTATSLNTEDAELEVIEINNEIGYYWENSNLSYVVWQCDGFTFSIITSLDKDEAIRVAISVKK